jgi:1,4-alpha-glucan branching enzyme
MPPSGGAAAPQGAPRHTLPSLRVLTLTADFPPAQWSGIGTAVFHQTNALRERGVEVEVLTPDRLAGRHFPLPVRGGDVVHLHSLALAELAFELTRRHALPLVYTAHSLLELELGPRAAQWIALQRRTFDEATRVMFVSHAERDAAIARIPSLAGKSHVLHNGVPTPPPLRAYDPNGPIVFAGRFTRGKGFDVVLELARALPWRFVLAGGHGDSPLQEEARRLNSDRCRVPGWLDRGQLDDLLASAALVLIPSRYEPFGMVAIEAMRLGAPVLASSRLAEVTPPGGRCLETLNVAEWMTACEALLADPAERESLHERGPIHVAERFDAKSLAAEAMAILFSGSTVD